MYHRRNKNVYQFLIYLTVNIKVYRELCEIIQKITNHKRVNMANSILATITNNN